MCCIKKVPLGENCFERTLPAFRLICVLSESISILLAFLSGTVTLLILYSFKLLNDQALVRVELGIC